MTLRTKGEIDTEKVVTVEAIYRATRTTVVETDRLGSLQPHRRRSEDATHGKVISSSVSRTNDAYDVRTTVYEKKYGSNANAVFDVRISANATEESIETHPDFVTILAGKGDEPRNRAVFKDQTSSAEFDYFPPNASNNLGGVDSYLVPSVVLEATREFDNFSDIGFEQIYKIGKISRPPVNFDVGNIRNWLVVGVLYDFNEDDGVWRVTVQYQLSGKEGWNDLIYEQA